MEATGEHSRIGESLVSPTICPLWRRERERERKGVKDEEGSSRIDREERGGTGAHKSLLFSPGGKGVRGGEGDEGGKKFRG